MASEKKILKNKLFIFCLIICGFSVSAYLVAFEVPNYMLIIQISAIVLSLVFAKNDRARKILILITIVITLLIGGFCYMKVSHNNQFLKRSQYLGGTRSAGLETTDVKDLIKAVIDNNKKIVGRNVIVTCRLPQNSPKDTYKTIEELEWLYENIDAGITEIDFEYDYNSLIENVEIFVKKSAL
jgi:hypothetical protein